MHDLSTGGVCVACATPPVDKSAAQDHGPASLRGRKRHPVHENGSSPRAANCSVFPRVMHYACENAVRRSVRGKEESRVSSDSLRARPGRSRRSTRSTKRPRAVGRTGMKGAPKASNRPDRVPTALARPAQRSGAIRNARLPPHYARLTERRRRFRSLLAQFPPRCRSRVPECAEYVRSASIHLRERFASSSWADPRFCAACPSTGELQPRDASGSAHNSLLRSGSWNAFHDEERYFR